VGEWSPYDVHSGTPGVSVSLVQAIAVFSLALAALSSSDIISFSCSPCVCQERCREPTRANRHGARVQVSLSCVLGIAIGYSGWWCRDLISATSYTLVGVINKLLTVTVSVLFINTKSSPMAIGALVICLLAGSQYEQVCSTPCFPCCLVLVSRSVFPEIHMPTITSYSRQSDRKWLRRRYHLRFKAVRGTLESCPTGHLSLFQLKGGSS
jgi:hypothetical protein